MNTVYDLFLNFQEDAFEFYEWSKQDTVEHIKRIPFIHIKNEDMYHFLNHEIQVSKQFLESIRNYTEKYDLKKLEYACLFSDGRMVVAVEFNKDGFSSYKSRLLLEDEEEVAQYASAEEEIKIEYQVITEKENQNFFTRKERKIKNFLEKEIVKSYQNKEESKMKYLYLEYFGEVGKSSKVMKEKLLSSMKDGLDKKHLGLYEMLLSLLKKKKV